MSHMAANAPAHTEHQKPVTEAIGLFHRGEIAAQLYLSNVTKDRDMRPCRLDAASLRQWGKVPVIPRRPERGTEGVACTFQDLEDGGEFTLDHTQPFIRHSGVFLVLIGITHGVDEPLGRTEAAMFTTCIYPLRIKQGASMLHHIPGEPFPCTSGSADIEFKEPQRVPCMFHAGMRRGPDHIPEGHLFPKATLN